MTMRCGWETVSYLSCKDASCCRVAVNTRGDSPTCASLTSSVSAPSAAQALAAVKFDGASFWGSSGQSERWRRPQVNTLISVTTWTDTTKAPAPVRGADSKPKVKQSHHPPPHPGPQCIQPSTAPPRLAAGLLPASSGVIFLYHLAQDMFYRGETTVRCQWTDVRHEEISASTEDNDEGGRERKTGMKPEEARLKSHWNSWTLRERMLTPLPSQICTRMGAQI